MRSRIPRLAVALISLLLLGPGLARACGLSDRASAPCMPGAPVAECCWMAGAGPCRADASVADRAGCCDLTGIGHGRRLDVATGVVRDLEPDPPAAALIPAIASAIPWPEPTGAHRSSQPFGVFLAGTRTYLLTARIRA